MISVVAEAIAKIKTVGFDDGAAQAIRDFYEFLE